MLRQCRIWRRLQSGPQHGFLLPPDPAWATRNRAPRQVPRLLLLDDVPFDGIHAHLKHPSGFSLGPTVGHRPDNALA